MERVAKAKFFKVEKQKADGPDFSECLREIADIEDEERELEIDQNVSVSVGRVVERDGVITGEIVRHQRRNLPSHTRRGQGIIPLNLGDGGALGHHAAFRYHADRGLLVIQTGFQAARPPLLGAYIRKQLHHGSFYFRVLLNRDAWGRLARGEPKVFRVKVATPVDLSMIQGMRSTMFQSMRDLREAYGGVSIDVTISMDRVKNTYLEKENLTTAVRELYDLNEFEGIDVKELIVRADSEEGVDPIDFFKGAMIDDEVIDLNDADIDAHYRARRLFLNRARNRKWEEIIEQLDQQ